MLQVTTASSVSPLADALAGMLSEPADDPMAAEWVAVPSAAMGRWLALELARSLGASRVRHPRPAGARGSELDRAEAPGPRDDGVVANVRFTYPGALRQCVLGDGEASGSVDPWQVDRLVWAVLEVLQDRQGDRRLGPLAELPEGATWFGRARRLADVLDRYALWRPDMVAQWQAGRDVDASGRPLADHQRWQPYLWRCVRRVVGVPSPPERLPELLGQLRSGTLSLELPPRLTVFGVTAIPGGRHALDLFDALAVHRQVHLLLLDPSPVAFERVRRRGVVRSAPAISRRDRDLDERGAGSDRSAVEHPLLRSWGRPVRERNALLSAHLSPSATVSEPLDGGAIPACTVLARLQRDIRADQAPAGDMAPRSEDRSVEFHTCHGPARQVDVLRDAISHLLADDPTLREEDIVVLCPAIGQFAPLVEAGFGPSAEGSTTGGGAAPDDVVTGAAGGIADDDAAVSGAARRPRLRYRVTDRSLRETSPVLGALDGLLELLAGRCAVSDLLAFAALEPVRRRFAFDDEALATLEHWVQVTNVRWGLDGTHRARWGLPGELTASSWRSGLDQLLMGVAVGDDDLQLAVGGIAPFGVEGDDIAVAGRFAALMATVEQLVDQVVAPRPVAQWCAVLVDAVEALFGVDVEDRWQIEQVEDLLRSIADQAVVGGAPASALLALADVRRLLAERLRGSPVRSDFFRGGITVTSLLPLRGLSYRVVCVLGLDEGALVGNSPTADGDDLVDADPRPGDPDPRGEMRLALLHGVLAAGERLVVTRTGRDPRTNAPVPASTAYAELHGAVLATVDPRWRAGYRARLETAHPCQPFDGRCFTPGALGRPGPWSFDPQSLAGARARFGRHHVAPGPSRSPSPVLVAPTAPRTGAGAGAGAGSATVTLAELTAFLTHPVAFYLREELGMFVPREDADVADDLFTRSSPLDEWAMADRLVTARVSGLSPDCWARVERARGQLPPGGFGDREVGQIRARVDELLTAAAAVDVDAGTEAGAGYRVEVVLDEGIEVVGTVRGGCGPDRPGPATVTVSRSSPKQQVAAWLALVALTGTDPHTQWRSVVVRRDEAGDGIDTLQLAVPGDTPAERRRRAVEGLAVAADCYVRGRREPLPLFPRLSFALHRGRGIGEAWRRFGGRGDGDDAALRVAFGPVELEELLAMPARHDDPPGRAPGRALRYANYLWGAIDTTALKLR